MGLSKGERKAVQTLRPRPCSSAPRSALARQPAPDGARYGKLRALADHVEDAERFSLPFTCAGEAPRTRSACRAARAWLADDDLPGERDAAEARPVFAVSPMTV